LEEKTCVTNTSIVVVLVSSCLAGLQQVLNDDVVAKLFLKYYQFTNVGSNSQYDPDEEWQNFCEALWKLLGYRGTDEVGRVRLGNCLHNL
jgi:hypothetical protein